jgi:hypothetical protein
LPEMAGLLALPGKINKQAEQLKRKRSPAV